LRMAKSRDKKDILVYAVGTAPALARSKEGTPKGPFRVKECAGRSDFWAALGESVPDVVVMDVDLAEPEDNLLERIQRDYFDLPIIVTADSADVDTVVKCMKRGAHDFVLAADAADKLPGKIEKAAEEHRLLVQVNQLTEAYRRIGKFGDLVGVSPAMQTVYTIIRNVTPTDATVFISGESGTGKELVAGAIHSFSPRSANKFVPVNCAAIPKDLLESELFGHEKGAFTGAEARRVGCCELADGGTLFLDEVAEMVPALQSKLLRFLQERCFSRVGGTETVRVDTRVVAATNRDPLQQVQEGRLRDDLFYRLNVVPIELPPLRERPEDIPVLAQHFLEVLGEKYNKYFVDFSAEAVKALLCYHWPGNVRELLNAIERIVVLGTTHQVTADLLPEHIRGAAAESELPSLSVEAAMRPIKGAVEPEGEDEVLPFEEVEKRAILSAVRKCGGDISKAARKLGLSRATLYRKLDRYGVR